MVRMLSVLLLGLAAAWPASARMIATPAEGERERRRTRQGRGSAP
jgi:hypothetical protein